MKLAHNRRSRGETTRSAYLDPYWLLGFASLMFGSLLNIVALSLGNQMFLASTPLMTVIINTGLSVVCLKERLLKIDIAGILIALLGSTLFMIQAKNESTSITQQSDLYHLYTRPISLIFLCFVLAATILAYRFDGKVRKELEAWYALMKSMQMRQTDSTSALTSGDYGKKESVDEKELRHMVQALGMVKWR